MTESRMTRSDLNVLFSDNFNQGFDPDIWTTDVAGWPGGKVTADNGSAHMEASTSSPAGPGIMAYCGFATRNRQFTPHLAGTNLLELTLVDYRHKGPFLNQYMTADGASSDHEDPYSGNYLMGFCLAIGTFRGLVGTGPVVKSIPAETYINRVVQIHFDWYSKFGLSYCLNRNLLSGDKEKIRVWGKNGDKEKWLSTHSVDCPVITIPGNSISLAVKHDPLGDNTGWGHCYGLLLTDDGNSLSWLLDGKLMDTVDISGFFSSSPDCVAGGAFVTIVGGASYQQNVWSVSDIFISGC